MAFGAGPVAILAIRWFQKETGSLDAFFLGLAALSVAITAVALLLPGERAAKTGAASVAPNALPAE